MAHILYQNMTQIGHFPLGGVAYNSPEFLSNWFLVSWIDTMKFPQF